MGACALDHNDDTTAGDATEKGWKLCFMPQSIQEFDDECLHQDMDEICRQVQDMLDGASDKKIDAEAVMDLEVHMLLVVEH